MRNTGEFFNTNTEMKKYFFVYMLILVSLAVCGQEKGKLKFYVGTFTSEGADGIYLCDFDTASGDISLDNTFKGVDDPSFLKISSDRKNLYVVARANIAIEKSGGYVIAYEIGENGVIHFLNKQASNGADPCYIDVSSDKKYVAIAAYNGGTTSLYPVNADGSLQPATSVIENIGSGPDKKRQDRPHAHSIRFSPFINQVFSTDLGTDQLNIFSIENNKLVQHGQKFVKMEPGAGPRHLEFHPNGKVIYVISELNSTVTVLQNKGDEWKTSQIISALPKDFKGISYSADIHISEDGKYLYASNRGHNSIVVFTVDKNTQKLTYKNTVSVEGDWPRNFSLSPDGRFMLVANQRSGNITVFKIDSKTGEPQFTGKEIKLPSPVCIDFL